MWRDGELFEECRNAMAISIPKRGDLSLQYVTTGVESAC